MKTAKRLVSLVAALVMVMSLVACGSNSEFVGTWECTTEANGQSITTRYEFKSNGDCVMSVAGLTIECEYETDGDKLIFSIEVLGVETTEEWTYKIDGNTMTLTKDGQSTVLKKK